jgi:hypothetical protein
MGEVLESPKGQLGFDLGEARPPQRYVPDIDDIRAELTAILDAVRSADGAAPWDARTFRYHKTVFPQMTNWLPENEREMMRVSFANAVARLEAMGVV